ncbi:LysM peptidoglycan-binding domain-containing protein [Flavobacterium agrisoli]|uniref:LysM peptidoglycan-binding domain-containing protein n=1 Tax=Flavobacterium agrisoli TaxID=2793066 RepID=A0A934PKT0_9FLAO|nr:LysM peptidoglycan-binding domain-containing protein [Flavobacterium agrisoli]MBK0369159.1 LysM peptidoglycan-binding domain-containing protein [Flavobacterium agrisoli]
MTQKLTILFVFLLTFNRLSAQDSIIEHKITKGETAYFIAQKYQVSLEDIYKLNPNSQNGLVDNQILKIPLSVKSNATSQSALRQHTVASKETLFGLSQQYHVSVTDLQNANQELLANGLQIGQLLTIPNSNFEPSDKENQNNKNLKSHLVTPKESLFSIARLYNVSVQDLENTNKSKLESGLQIGQTILIPNKKKTLDGRFRVINNETIFHTVAPQETKYAIAKKYGISIEQLEIQNPEIVTNLVEGNKLAININQIKPTSDNEELMLVLAEKQVLTERSKIKTAQLEDMKDRLVVQKEMNQKVIKINELNLDLKAIGGNASVEKLRLVLEANKNVQMVLMAKLDSLIASMNEDLTELKKMPILNLEESKQLEKESYQSIRKTNELSQDLKKELAENRKTYSDLMNKVEKIAVAENQEYKKKVRENEKNKTNETLMQRLSFEEIKQFKIDNQQNDAKNQLLLAKLDSIDTQKQIEVKRHISKASFYSAEARTFDDKLALVKLKKYQEKALSTQQNADFENDITKEEIAQYLKENSLKKQTELKIETFDNLKEVADGYYLVLGVFSEAKERDAFIMKLIDAGEFNSSFFFNVNSLNYYVYCQTYPSLEETLYKLKRNETKTFFENAFVSKVALYK